MPKESYKAQAALILEILPELTHEECFAIHGGTAINLFVRDLPRLSVDIDVTFLPLLDRESSLSEVKAALERIKHRLEYKLSNFQLAHIEFPPKLLIRKNGVEVKLEVNTVNRGCFEPPEILPLCIKAQQEFKAFVEARVVETGHLYGGKICAALDRQHPRDLFDIKKLLEAEGITIQIKKGFLFYALCSSRPIYELLNPHVIDQRNVFEKQFRGMTQEDFTYQDFENTRNELNYELHNSITHQDKEFLIDFHRLNPEWYGYDFEKYPAVQWKLNNIKKLKVNNPQKYLREIQAIEQVLFS